MRARRKKGRGNAILNAIIFILIFLAFFFVLGIGVPLLLFVTTLVSENDASFISQATSSFIFGGSAVAYLLIVNRGNEGLAERLGLDRKAFSLHNLSFGILLFIAIVLLEIVLGLASSITGIQINTNANLFFVGAPLWFYVFAAFVAPLNEEVLFRGLMVPRIGIFVSSLLFALPHVNYGSTFAVDVLAAFIFGALSGYIYSRTGSLYPSLLAHILVNLFTVLSILSF